MLCFLLTHFKNFNKLICSFVPAFKCIQYVSLKLKQPYNYFYTVSPSNTLFKIYKWYNKTRMSVTVYMVIGKLLVNLSNKLACKT